MNLPSFPRQSASPANLRIMAESLSAFIRVRLGESASIRVFDATPLSFAKKANKRGITFFAFFLVFIYTLHMTNTSIIIKNRVLTLPKELETDWQDAEVSVRGDADILIVKKLLGTARRPLSAFGKRLRKAGRNIGVRDIAKAVASVRSCRT